nr:immunoglobulin heavy chain junction region [Macaca mulatta]MOW90512.1 immunoglobulin heavy chain junction region [Macaca mulatta]MOW90735.1 immunoglobulin heavy chain junction region [Macaca mulatta]MOW92955.1 immunoglobulin heavy chain junction region [Macaca mulatta]
CTEGMEVGRVATTGNYFENW